MSLLGNCTVKEVSCFPPVLFHTNRQIFMDKGELDLTVPELADSTNGFF